MNYYQYKRRAPRSRVTDFVKPFLVIIIFIGVIVAAWYFLGSALNGGGEKLSSEKVFLDIETGGAKAMTSGDSEWKNVPTSIYLYEDERLKTQSDGRVTLTFFDKDTVRLDKSTELEFAALSRNAAGNLATLEVEEGKLWLDIEESGTGTEFTVKTGLLTLKSNGGIFALTHPGMLYVLEGSVRADIEHEGKIVKSSTIGVGQELIVDEKIAADLSEDLQKEVVFALDDAFKSSNWYRWNMQQDGSSLADDEDIPLDDEDSTGEVTEDDTDTDEDTEEEEEDEEIDENDKEPPTTPQINEPGSNGDTVTLDDVEQTISGSVSSDTEAVIVNDYRLSLYIPGSGKFAYYAKVSYDNLEVGENEYEVIALDKAGNKSDAATITLVLPQEVSDETETEDEEEDEGSESSTPEASSSGGVTITSPNNGENLVSSETSFEIKGDVPTGTVKVVVNSYTLQGFSEGDSTFLYRASSTLGTLEIGELNTYTVKAYDEDDEVIGSASMTIDVESSETGSGDPVITMPSSSATYSTTLDQLVVGGTVGKWVEIVYLNSEKLDNYIPGSEAWQKTITLTPGENVFSVYGEKDGEKTSTATITINYQN